MNAINKALKAIRYLGFSKLWYYFLYQLGLYSGHYRRVTPPVRDSFQPKLTLKPYTSYPIITKAHQDLAIAEADLVLKGCIRLFGANFSALDLSEGASEHHWSKLEKESSNQDVKFTWEPARFGWAFTLARAYAFSSNPSYAEDFWQKTDQFIALHPPNLGRQWQSGQEVAIRLMAWVFCDRVFASAESTTHTRRLRLWQAIAEHAQRIPPTLVYARAQNNNHLISEAAGLYTAGLYLKDHPQAQKWQSSGWHWLNWAFQNQIDEFGTYVQHSTNYHRLMLQIALFTDHMRRLAEDNPWPSATLERLKAAVRWLLALTDPQSGRTPNLGANDGALILPLSSLPYDDHRPVIDAAAKAFLNQDIYQMTSFAEMADWFSMTGQQGPQPNQLHAPDMLRVDSNHGRAFIHVTHFTDRPSHADQLHTDLWWKGVNVAMDSGSYRYNAPPPWNNALAGTAFHNTVMVDGQEQMLKAGRFLWLDWAQAEILAYEMDNDGRIRKVNAEHQGYCKLGAIHQRTLERLDQGWLVSDDITPCGRADNKRHQVQLTWLLPDWKWQLIAEHALYLQGPVFGFELTLTGTCELNLYRADERLHGDLEGHPTWGWVSPTYNLKHPVLMVVAAKKGALPIHIQSKWQFINNPT